MYSISGTAPISRTRARERGLTRQHPRPTPARAPLTMPETERSIHHSVIVTPLHVIQNANPSHPYKRIDEPVNSASETIIQTVNRHPRPPALPDAASFAS